MLDWFQTNVAAAFALLASYVAMRMALFIPRRILLQGFMRKDHAGLLVMAALAVPLGIWVGLAVFQGTAPETAVVLPAFRLWVVPCLMTLLLLAGWALRLPALWGRLDKEAYAPLPAVSLPRRSLGLVLWGLAFLVLLGWIALPIILPRLPGDVLDLLPAAFTPVEKAEQPWPWASAPDWHLARALACAGLLVALLVLLTASGWRWLIDRPGAAGGWGQAGAAPRGIWLSLLLASTALLGAVLVGWGWWLDGFHASALLVAGLCFLPPAVSLRTVAEMVALRERCLVLMTAPNQPEEAPEPREPRKIIVFCDGTSNSPEQVVDGKRCPTSIHRMFEALIQDETQLGWYHAGVGTGTTSAAERLGLLRRAADALMPANWPKLGEWPARAQMALEAATGMGITQMVGEAYCHVVRHYRPGDQIYLFGFSRGAYAARCVAGMIHYCGLLRGENNRYAADVVALYRERASFSQSVPISPALRHQAGSVRIEMLGVFDSVASLGLPLWGWWFNIKALYGNRGLHALPLTIYRRIFHALSMDERRSQFVPVLFAAPPLGQLENSTPVEQRWFRGAHADIGGGYPERGLADIPLAWILGEALASGLRFQPGLAKGLCPDPMAPVHDEVVRQPAWRFFGTWPRWHPVSADGGPWGRLDQSVLQRAAGLAKIGREELLRLPVGGSRLVRLEAQRDWHRTPLILEKGALYRIAWKGGEWVDAKGHRFNPAGASAVPSALQRWRLRLPERLPMELAIAINHPRDWPLKEGGLGALLSLVLWRPPTALRAQVLPIGKALLAGPVVVENLVEDGVLHGFANDGWSSAAKNAGSLLLEITRIDPDTPGVEGRFTLSGAAAETSWSPPPG